MAIGSLALTTLPGCGRNRVASAGTSPALTPIAVQVDTTPPAELLLCPQPPVAFPVDQAAVLPVDVRSALTSLAFAYRATLDQLQRLIAWHRPPGCVADAQAQ